MPAVLEQADDAVLRKVVLALLNGYYIPGLYREGVGLLQLIEIRQRRAPPLPSARLVLADVLNALGLFAVREGEIAQAGTLFAESAAIFVELDAAPLPGDSTDPCIGQGLVALI